MYNALFSYFPALINVPIHIFVRYEDVIGLRYPVFFNKTLTGQAYYTDDSVVEVYHSFKSEVDSRGRRYTYWQCNCCGNKVKRLYMSSTIEKFYCRKCLGANYLSSQTGGIGLFNMSNRVLKELEIWGKRYSWKAKHIKEILDG